MATVFDIRITSVPWPSVTDMPATKNVRPLRRYMSISVPVIVYDSPILSGTRYSNSCLANSDPPGG